MTKRLLVLPWLAFFIALPTYAAEGKIPIFEPTVIDARPDCDPETSICAPISGKYILTNNISATSGSAIRIIGRGADEVDDVEIDLNGFTLEGGASGDDVVRAEGLRNFVLRNGVIRHLGTTKDCVRVLETRQAKAQGLRITGGRYGIFMGVKSGEGTLGVKSFNISGNTIENTEDNAILVNFTLQQGSEDVEVAEGTIADNTIRDVGKPSAAPSGARGIEVRFGVSSVEITNNRIERPHTYGLTVNSRGAVVISGNRVNATGYRGIIASRTEACRISDNVVKGAGKLQDADPSRGGDGIFVNDTASNCLLLNNVSSNNWMSGIRVEGDRNHIDRNVLNFNRLAGLHLESIGSVIAESNTFGRNTARGNSNTGETVGNCTANPGCNGLSEPEFCDEGSNNTSFGDNLAGPGPPC